MVGQLISVNAGPVFNGNGLPPITQDAVDMAAAQMPSLEHYMDPEKLKAKGEISRSKGDGRLITFTSTSAMTIGTVAGKYNGRNVLKSPGNTLGLDIGPGGLAVSPSFTFVIACDLAAAMRSGTTDGYLLAAYNPTVAGFMQVVRFFGNAGKGLLFTARSSGGGGSASLDLASVPAADTPFVLAVSYDAATTQIRAYINTTTAAIASADANVAPTPDKLTKLQIGYPIGNPATAWVGNIGKVLAFSRSFHKTAVDLALLENLMISMRTHYGII
ncbi:hypothetical protein [Neorhizobium alkalisoli]|uniref:Concanavalin A-like lectin/glucanase superfamily protein n=1 Tax=Neorhizobium alkalisoli TaxID=528178 RepID=A0A561Q7V3_9HYPH|nr:hypothetical protein [Neorhizobium alkalisoli]TWF46431.1 hypothetical protein FHW37_115128 [Neorhizobium alkalisoli]